MTKTILFCTILIILKSCNSSEIKVKKAIGQIDISEIFNLKIQNKYLSEFAGDFEYFRPEAKPGSYFSMMGISYIGSEFVILWEKRTSQLYAFRRDGKFIGELGKKGQGPNEYLTVRDVFVFPHIKELHLSDFKRKRILRYGFDLKYLGELKLNPFPLKMHIYKDKYYLCAYSDKDLKENGGNDLILRDPVSLNELKVLWERNNIASVQISETDFINNAWFIDKQDSLYFARKILNNINIYKIVNDKLELSLILHDNSATTENSFKLTQFLNHILFFNDYLLLGFQKDNQTYTGYYNLRSKKLSNFKIINDFDKGPDFFPMGQCADKGFYSDDIKLQYFSEFWKTVATTSPYNTLKSKFPEREKWLRETIPKSQDDNPWIMIIQPHKNQRKTIEN
jgi:hypothetical protein